MEKRAVLAAILMAGLLLLYQALFLKSPETETPRPQKAETRAPASGERPPAGAPASVAPVAPLPAGAPPPPARQAVVETPLYRAVIGSAGGALREWELNYRGQTTNAVHGAVASQGLTITRPGMPPQLVAFGMSAERISLGRESPQGQLELVGEDGFGLRITRTMKFRFDSYAVDEEIKVENRHNVAQAAEIDTPWSATVDWPKEAEGKALKPVHVVKLTKGAFWARRELLASAEGFVGDALWIGLESGVPPAGQNGVYLTALVPKSPGLEVVEERRGEADPRKPPKAVEIGLRAKIPALAPGQAWRGHLVTYIGPMEYERLSSLDVGLEKAIYFGGFPIPESWAAKYGAPTIPMEWIVVPILWLMHWFYGFTRNYGVSIIILTIVAKVLFFPLSVKSMRSMKAMQAIQPQVNAIRAKYKSEPQRVQQETMDLYRKHGVNPLGGCLPMVVQIPIFYALYTALSVSVELQNAPFLCFGRLFGVDVWICNLAAHDPTYVLPILMGVSMFVQQKMTPVMGDPRQAKMMLFMPVVFTFMFFNLASGLVLYWTLSNVLQIAQQHYMNRDAKASKAPMRAPKKA